MLILKLNFRLENERIGLLAKKIGMSRFYDSAGLIILLQFSKLIIVKIVEVKTIEKNGYKSVRFFLE